MGFTVNFYLNNDNRLKKKERYIYCYIRQNYQTISLHVNEKVDPKYWDKERQRVKKSHANALEINAYLDKYKAHIENKRREFFAIKPDGSFAEFRHFLKSSSDVLFFELFDKYIEFKKASGSHGIARKVELMNKHFKIFEGVVLNNMDVQKLDEFKINLEKNKISINTQRKYFQFLFGILRFGLERGISINRAFEKYKIEKRVHTTHIALTRQDLERLRLAELSDRLQKVRDVFLFQLYTGQRYSDVLLFNKVDVKDDIWYLRAKKTRKNLEIPLIEPAIIILKKYNFDLPKISNQKQNKL